MSGNLSPHEPIVAGGVVAVIASTIVETGFPAQRTIRSVVASIEGATTLGDVTHTVTVKDNADGTITIYAWRSTDGTTGTTLIAGNAARNVQWFALAD